MILIPSNSTNDYRLIRTPESRHLILDLIGVIACSWHAKLACASRTLPDEFLPSCPLSFSRFMSTVSVSKFNIQACATPSPSFCGGLVARGAHE
ncbi:hypothetical protein AZE42_06520 [Rhizopogon vesiculosus]|uniref:Uncharacterized protein n=1 Tax=Rhizopogon vesiculosus TaxID=180088 RepID=A0A1J8QLQ1_9AGAM|nr:hypothetical protein AZE42_06520 [Rhizopogon vesiculosus]